MRTTIDLPDDIHALASELSHQYQKTMSEVITEFIRRGISSQSVAGSDEVPETNSFGWPILSAGRVITPEDVRSCVLG